MTRSDRTVVVHRAGDIGNTCVPTVTIRIEDPIDAPDDIEVLKSRFRNDASSVFMALTESLPGGTLDQLLCLLLQHRATLFRVPQ